jgi:hypothetical protein
MRPMTGFEEAIESRFDTGWIASSQVFLAVTHDARFPIAKLIQPLRRSMRHCHALDTWRPNLTAARFSEEEFPLLRGNRRFRGDGSITRLPPTSPVLSHAIHRYGSAAAGSPHACRKPARIFAPRLSV